ncbi:reverse transcriptase domain-containing protein [Tanacetum coccineum]
MHTTRQMMSSEAIEELIAQRVADALLTYEINWNTRNENRNGSHDVGSGNTRTMHTVKYATYTLLNGALTWWNSYVEMVGMDVAYEMSWKDLMKMMTAELVLLCPKMVPNEEEKIKRVRDTPNKDNHVQQPPYKRQILARAYTAGPGEKKIAVTNQRVPVANQKTIMFFEFGRLGHYRSKCPKLKNQNRGNPVGNGEARGRVHALGGGEANQDPNIVTSTFLFNNRYAAILFDTGADKSFVSTAFSFLIDIAPSALDTKYDIELADGKTIGF